MPLGGIDALTDPVHVLPGKLLRLQNGRFDQPGGISKRTGYTVRSSAIFSDSIALITSGVRLAETTDGEQLLFDERNVYAFEEHTNAQQWVDRGRPGDSLISSELVNFDQAANLNYGNIAIAPNGIRLVCWFGASGGEEPVFKYFVSTREGTVLVKGSAASTSFNAHLLEPFVKGTEIWALIPQNFSAGHDIRWGAIDSTDDDPTELTFTPTSFTSPALSSNYWDLTKATAAAGSNFAICHSDSTDADDMHVSLRTAASPPVQVWNRDTGVSGAEIYCTALLVHGGSVWFAYGSADETRVIVINETTGVISGADALINTDGSDDVVRIGMCAHSSGKVLICWERRKGDATASPPSARLPYVQWALIDTTPAVVGTVHTCSDVAMIAKPYAFDDQFYLPVMHTGKGYGHGFLIQVATSATSNATGPSWRGTFSRDICSAEGLDDENDAVQIDLGGNVPGRGHVPNVVSGGVFGEMVFPVRSAERFEVAKENDDPIIIRHCGIRAVTSIMQGSIRNWAQWGQGMFITSGRPSWYDGVQLSEHGFAWAPSVDRDDPSDFVVDPGGVLTAGDYDATCIFQYQDVNGQLQQSEPSATMGPVTAALNDEGHITFKNTLLTDRAAPDVAFWSSGVSRARVIAYRTTVGPGALMFRAVEFLAGSAIPPNETTSGTTAPSLQIDFAQTTEEDDEHIQNNEVLYTTGGILPNTGTPPAEVCHVHGGRLWLAQLEEKNDVWFSQPFVALEAPRFNGNLKLRFDEPVFSLGTLDDKLIVGCERSLFVVTGNGPPAAGDIDIGFQIERLAGDVGCVDHRSMVSTPIGLMFFAAGRGFMLLDRSLQLQEIGAPVRQYLFNGRFGGPLFPDFAPIRCGTLVADQTQVRWLTNVSIDESTATAWFVYDYRVGEWSVDTTENAGFAVDSIAFDHGKDYAYLTSEGTVFDESDEPGDGGAFISMAMETPWIKLDTLQGWQRVRSVTLLGRRSADPGSIVIAIGYDYEDSYTQSVRFTAAEIGALSTDVMQLKVRFGRQKCEAFRIAINDGQLDEGEGLNAGLRISSLVFEAGLKRGTMKLKQEQKK